jgi:hypothetical protein
VLSFLFLSNVTYRILCLLGLAAMVIRGGDRRLLGIAAAGTYAIYVVLTCLFYFVGLAYDSVSQVTLFILFIGLLDTVRHLVQRVYVSARERYSGFLWRLPSRQPWPAETGGHKCVAEPGPSRA